MGCTIMNFDSKTGYFYSTIYDYNRDKEINIMGSTPKVVIYNMQNLIGDGLICIMPDQVKTINKPANYKEQIPINNENVQLVNIFD